MTILVYSVHEGLIGDKVEPIMLLPGKLKKDVYIINQNIRATNIDDETKKMVEEYFKLQEKANMFENENRELTRRVFNLKEGETYSAEKIFRKITPSAIAGIFKSKKRPNLEGAVKIPRTEFLKDPRKYNVGEHVLKEELKELGYYRRNIKNAYFFKKTFPIILEMTDGNYVAIAPTYEVKDEEAEIFDRINEIERRLYFRVHYNFDDNNAMKIKTTKQLTDKNIPYILTKYRIGETVPKKKKGGRKTVKVRAHVRRTKKGKKTRVRAHKRRKPKRSKWAMYLDKKRRAKKPGKRISKSGRVYYEYRPNRSDKNPRKKI